jgi:8-hydroxy-5-deazaflavin:NADPH oxidoreductase
MRVGIVGAGRIGGNAARLFVQAGHEVMVSFSRDLDKLERLAATIGATVGSPTEAAQFGDALMLSVPWTLVDDVLAEIGSLAGKVVIDTTNHFAAGGLADLDGVTAAQVNQARMPDARLVKAFNTLTAGFQAAVADRTGPDRVVMFLCGDDPAAKEIVSGLVEDAGFSAVDLGSLADGRVMEAPRRPGAVYGEEYHEAEARRFVAEIRAGSRDPAGRSSSPSAGS